LDKIEKLRRTAHMAYGGESGKFEFTSLVGYPPDIKESNFENRRKSLLKPPLLKLKMTLT